MLKPISLTGEQKKILFLPVKKPIQVKGVAGSGKTTVALYRAKHLLENETNLFSEAKVAIFTYSSTLSTYITEISRHIGGGYQKDSDELKPKSKPGINVKITNFHKWAYRFLVNNGISLFEKISVNDSKSKTISGRIQDEFINKIKQKFISFPISRKSNEFFKEEISWIKGKLFNSEQEYLDAQRTGRGTEDRVNKEDKKVIWKIYRTYEEELRRNDKYDFDDYALLSLNIIQNDPSFVPPFSHLIIDEAQDLNKAQILVLSKLVSEETQSITIIADAAQRIFKSGFTWKDVGINIQGGRTKVLKINYRNTIPIVKAALSLLDKEKDNTEFTKVEAAVKGDKKPIVGYFNNSKNQLKYLKKELDNLISKKDIDSTVILHRDNKGLSIIGESLEDAGYDIDYIRKNKNQAVNYNSESIKICTLSSIKGLEFTNVFIVDLNDDIMPYPPGFNGEDDEYHISTERRLLYTSMTRARKNLYLLSSGTPSRYLSEIEEELLDVYIDKTDDEIDDLPF